MQRCRSITLWGARLCPVTLLLIIAACASRQTEVDEVVGAASASLSTDALQDAFWYRLQQHCGQAFSGKLGVAPEGDTMLTGTEELVVHFRECSENEMKLPFHIEKEATNTWDRSRTWVFMRTPAGLELRHDHRHEDGTPDSTTWYGAHTLTEGTETQQEFILTDRTARDGSPLGWRVEIIPWERYTYGTTRGGEWTWRVDFDLTRQVTAPPAPWGHGDGGIELRPPAN